MTYQHFRNPMLPAPLAVPEAHRDVIDHTLLVSLGLTPDRAHEWIAKTAALRNSCGCDTGAAFVVIAVIVYPFFWYWLLSENPYSKWLAVPVGLFAAFVAGGVGKFIGLLVAQLRLRFRLRNVRLRKASQNG